MSGDIFGLPTAGMGGLSIQDFRKGGRSSHLCGMMPMHEFIVSGGQASPDLSCPAVPSEMEILRSGVEAPGAQDQGSSR